MQIMSPKSTGITVTSSGSGSNPSPTASTTSAASAAYSRLDDSLLGRLSIIVAGGISALGVFMEVIDML